MDDWHWYKEGAAILEDHRVTVHGRIDDDLFETTSIEANSAYVESLGNYFYASAADDRKALIMILHAWHVKKNLLAPSVSAGGIIRSFFHIHHKKAPAPPADQQLK